MQDVEQISKSAHVASDVGSNLEQRKLNIRVRSNTQGAQRRRTRQHWNNRQLDSAIDWPSDDAGLANEIKQTALASIAHDCYCNAAQCVCPRMRVSQTRLELKLLLLSAAAHQCIFASCCSLSPYTISSNSRFSSCLQLAQSLFFFKFKI